MYEYRPVFYDPETLSSFLRELKGTMEDKEPGCGANRYFDYGPGRCAGTFKQEGCARYPLTPRF